MTKSNSTIVVIFVHFGKIRSTSVWSLSGGVSVWGVICPVGSQSKGSLSSGVSLTETSLL